jgi:hypothetical protein
MKIRALFTYALLGLLSGTAACSNMQVATGDRITPMGTPGSPTAPINSDADRQAVYNQSGQGVVPDATPRTVPLSQQASDINSRQLPDVPPTQSPNITPETRSQQQTPQPQLIPRP